MEKSCDVRDTFGRTERIVQQMTNEPPIALSFITIYFVLFLPLARHLLTVANYSINFPSLTHSLLLVPTISMRKSEESAGHEKKMPLTPAPYYQSLPKIIQPKKNA